MSGSGQPIVQARIYQIRSQSNVGPLLSILETDRVNNFKEKIKEDDENGAVEELQLCFSQKATVEMLRIAVNSRKNDLITNVLQSSLQRQEPEMNGGGMDTTDFKHPVCSNDIFQTAVLYSALNDDPKTLEAVLEWGSNNNQKAPEESKRKNCPILIASLEDYTQCIKHLYRFGYKIKLPDEDKERIETVLTMNDALANDMHFYYSLCKGKKNMEEVSNCVGPFHVDVRKVKKISLEFDPVERFLRFKAFANPHYISVDFLENGDFLKNEENNDKLRMLDPIRKSFALARYSKHLSSYYTQHSQEYNGISRKCQDFAQDVLEQCDNIQEVEMLLEHSPNLNDDENNENTNWHLALWEGHKKFVGHHYFQNFLWNKITGENFNWDNYFLFWRILYFPLAVLLFCLIPLVVVVDSLFRKSDILFVSPQMLNKKKPLKNNVGKQESDQAFRMNLLDSPENEQGNSSILPFVETDENDGQENGMFSFFRERIHRPIFRMIVYHFLEVVFLIALGFSMIDPKVTTGKSELWFYDIVTMIFVINYFIEDVLDIFRRKWTFFSSFWSFYSLINHSLFMLGGCLSSYGFYHLEDDNRAKLSGNHIVNVGSTFVSIAASMAFFRTVRWLLLQRTLGPVVVCIIKVLKDTFHIFLLFIIIFVSFAIGTFSMFKPFTLQRSNDNSFKMKEENLAKVKGLFSAMFWRVFDPGEPDLASIVNATTLNGKDVDVLSLEFSHFMGLAFWAVYQAIIVILLINILIAMMNTTYTKVSEHADIEWKYSKSYYQVQFLAPRAVLPPPFRMFYYFSKLIRFLKRKCVSCCGDKLQGYGQEDRGTRHKDYLKLLLKLVKTKQHSDYENSIQDDFRDLRQDIQNIVSDKQKSVHEEIDGLKKKMDELMNEIRSLKN
eukprot:GFUD01005353.1.p1 GENE.GFUD01005353.1~~GFUD01005353.1.p1  ORF type:complete len:895 (-),score=157.64 GFUD01005353.1:705-3389(-)